MIPPSVLHDSLTVPDGGNHQLWNGSIERRRTKRAQLHWTIYVVAGGSTHPFRTETRDISRDGFYCVLDRPVTPGHQIQCDIVVPTYKSLPSGVVVRLRCDAEVVRVEQIHGSGRYGIGCTIKDYQLVYHRAEESPTNAAGES